MSKENWKQEVEAIKLKIHDLPEYKNWPGQVSKDRVLEVFNKKLKLPEFTERIKALEAEVCPLREELVNKREEISQLKAENKAMLDAIEKRIMDIMESNVLKIEDKELLRYHLSALKKSVKEKGKDV